MKRYSILFILSLCFMHTALCQYNVSGRVISSRDSIPVAFAMVSFPANGLWTMADEQGMFSIRNVPAGNAIIAIQCLGYEKMSQELVVKQDIAGLTFRLHEDNLTLDEVAITAKRGADPGTSYIIDRKALDHLQMISVPDAAALLPGGKTNRTLHLATDVPQEFLINGGGSERGNANFGVAIEVDGVRLSNNALPHIEGSDTRNIASSNIESIEVIPGIPSVEHGDMTNGMVRIKTRKGKSPFIAELMTRPNVKQASLSKGFGLGPKGGVLNVNAERSRSVSDLASPYTSYDRNALSFNYSNTFNQHGSHPLTFSAGIAGNAGGYNTEPDPDLFVNTYRKVNDGMIRGNFSADWLLNKPWITNIELSGSVNYNDTQTERSVNKSGTLSAAAIHVTEEGYHVGELYDENPAAGIVLIPPGFWYEKHFDDSKVLNYSARIKANWFRKYGAIDNHLMAGGDYSGSGNRGRGEYYEDPRYAPTWREYRYDQVPNINNYAFFAENNTTIPVHHSELQITAGLRSEITAVKGSQYGTVGNLSPRFNAKYILWEHSERLIRDLSIRVGWGKTVKLPSFYVLYPEPSYADFLTFAPGTTPDGKTFYGYYTMPGTQLYNPDLKWQRNIQQEVGLNMNIGGVRLSLTYSRDKTYDPYDSGSIYTPFTYKFTDQSNLEGSAIPIENRIYSVDKYSGIVTVTDRTGALPSETLSYKERPTVKSNSLSFNGSPAERRTLRWTVDFPQIHALKTTVNIDGKYYYYKGIDEMIKGSRPATAQTMADGNPYKYIGYYAGGAASANGSISKNLDMNLTVTTHVSAIRMIFSARLEGSLYDYTRYLSEYSKGSRGFVLDSKDDYFPSATKTDIYGGDRFVGVYPEYYISLDDMNTRVPFAEKFAWAKGNDITLYNELAKMVVKSNYSYYFNEGGVSPYFSANIGITKEIGNTASISFNATNFFNNAARVHSRQTGEESTLFSSARIPKFYYGLSLRLKW